ncbi:hypothetical protein KJ877_01380 [bacterium]|nr:hypothetical protein [bacterium]MBU1989915.1 hypothetical protein [bacterium]
MDVMLLVKSIVGLLVVLGILVLLFLIPFGKKNTDKKEPRTDQDTKKQLQDKQKTDLESLRLIIRNRKTSSAKLKEALDLVLKYHGTIHNKLGVRPHPDFLVYEDILCTICRHPNTNKDIILKFDRELEKRNPSYKKDINEAITKGLNSRGA